MKKTDNTEKTISIIVFLLSIIPYNNYGQVQLQSEMRIVPQWTLRLQQ